MIGERHPDHEEPLAKRQAHSEAPLSAEAALDRVLSTLGLTRENVQTAFGSLSPDILATGLSFAAAHRELGTPDCHFTVFDRVMLAAEQGVPMTSAGGDLTVWAHAAWSSTYKTRSR
jgi:hypothetical protein